MRHYRSSDVTLGVKWGLVPIFGVRQSLVFVLPESLFSIYDPTNPLLELITGSDYHLQI